MIESQQSKPKPASRPITKRDLFFIVVGISVFLLWYGVIFKLPGGHSRAIGHGNMTIDVAPADDSILFNATGKGGRDLYLLRLADLSVTRIAETPDYEVAPRFAPDGKSIVYAAGVTGDKADHLFTMRLDGTGKKQLTKARGNDTDPCYSPQGTLIAFARDKTYNWGGLAANWENGGVICVVNVDGTGERQLTPDDEFAYSPHFSADGQQVLYSTEAGLFSVPVSGNGGPTRLGPAHDDVAFSSTGPKVVFAEGEFSPDYELFISNIDGTEKTQITHSDNGCFHPVFDRTDKRVFFLTEEWPGSFSGYPKSSIWSVNTDGTEQKQLTDLSLFDDPLNWQPKASP